MSDKIRPQHLARKAILYVRQSSPYQVIHNLESQKLQYAMEARLHQLGWHEIEVVDEDLGRSAAGLVTRAGFERMVAEVCLGKVGRMRLRRFHHHATLLKAAHGFMVAERSHFSPSVGAGHLHLPAPEVPLYIDALRAHPLRAQRNNRCAIATLRRVIARILLRNYPRASL